MPADFVTGLVLAAGGSSRLGQPKQLLPYRGATLLDAVLGNARGCGFDQLLVTLGGAAEDVRSRVDLSGAEVVLNEAYGTGCSSSIAAAVGALDSRCNVLVLLLGDQPGVTPPTVGALLDGRGAAAIAVCRYDDGLGHPFAFSRELFGELSTLHGDKAIWKYIKGSVPHIPHAEVPIPGPIPRDVDTWADYEAIL